MVITELEVGGAERCLVNLATGLPAEMFRTAVYSLAPRPAAGSDLLVRRLEQASIPVHFLGARSIRQFFPAIGQLRRQLTEYAPDVVQTFLFHANVLGARAVRGKARPALVTGVRVADPSRWRQRLEAWSTRRVDRIVCVSRAVAEFCQQQAGFPQAKLQVIPNGIDLSDYPPDRRLRPGKVGLPNDRRLLLFVGRLHPQKGLDWLLGLTPQLFERMPNHELVLVGDGPQRAELQSMAERLGVADRVRLLGWRADARDLMAAADLLILPSRWEGMPNVVLEAMASGLPVVATRAAGVVELLGPAAPQQTVEFGDGRALIDAIVRTATDPGKSAELGQANRQRVAQHFSLQAMIDAYSELYRSLRKPDREA